MDFLALWSFPPWACDADGIRVVLRRPFGPFGPAHRRIGRSPNGPRKGHGISSENLAPVAKDQKTRKTTQVTPPLMASTEEYRYTFEPYKGPASKYTCPSCAHRHTFTRYVDKATGEHLDESLGRCDRQDKCGYDLRPQEYFAAGGERPTGEWRPAPPPPELPGYRMSRTDVRATMGNDRVNNLLTYLGSVLDPALVRRTAWEYCVGTWTAPGALNGAAAFWQVDRTGEVRTAKLVQYDPSTGHRVKGAQHWTHSLAGGVPECLKLEQCLFGEHLLAMYPEAPVGIVEAEKTALIARLLVPEVLWVATGGLTELKMSKVLPLAGRNVTLWPDLGEGFATWSAKASELSPLFASLEVVDLLERVATPEERANALDLADYLLSQVARARMAALQPPAMPPTAAERKVLEWATINPAIHGMIRELDLELNTATMSEMNNETT